jgi:uncharacterized membrane protein YgdD (TMEM256/DUF423 family)
MARVWVAIGAANAFLAVGFGAFGAHALRDTLSAQNLDVYRTAANYQMAHALGLILLGVWSSREATRLSETAGWLMFAGILLFSGSLYALALTSTALFGAITPFGGLCFLAAWALFAAAVLREERTR